MADEFIPTLTHATERDIDLLLVEELYASPPFVAWLCGRAGLAGEIAASTVLHSKRRTRSRREIDMFVDLTFRGASKGALLIENKLDATEQPDQAESYREELASLAATHTLCRMIIACPSAYRDAHPLFTGKFDAVITYEELARYFRGRAGDGHEAEARMRFRADLMDQAVNKHRRGYTAVPNEQIGNFNARYVSLLREIAPDIAPGPTMLKAANPDESVSMIFDHHRSFAELPADVRPTRFAHELGRGQQHRSNYVAVVFGGWGGALTAVKDRFETDARELGATFSAKPPTKVRPRPGLVMSCPTDAIDNQGDFDDQRARIAGGIERAACLRKWLIENQNLLRGWKMQVEATMVSQ